MTCEEFDCVTGSDGPENATVAMRAAIASHYIACAGCRRMLMSFRGDAPERIGPSEFSESVLSDPEATAVITNTFANMSPEQLMELANDLR